MPRRERTQGRMRGPKPARRGFRMALIGFAIALSLPLLALFVPNPLSRRVWAWNACVDINGRWDDEHHVCDYGVGGRSGRLLEHSRRCQSVPSDVGLRECRYAADGLKIHVVGVGTSLASVGIDGADGERGYAADVFLGNGCVMVTPGSEMKEADWRRRTEHAFISTKTGNVHSSLLICGLDESVASDAGFDRSPE